MRKSKLPDDWKGHPDGTPRVVEAGISATGAGVLGPKSDLARRVEQAMSDAILKALADGIPMSDAQAIRARMLEARQRVLDTPDTQ